MLKIKDNVDLKELEKFGFKSRYDENTGEIKYMYYEVKVDMFIYKIMVIPQKEINDDNDNTLIRFWRWLKPKKIYTPKSVPVVEVNNYGAFLSEKTIELLYDLIKADMVEKVEE